MVLYVSISSSSIGRVMESLGPLIKIQTARVMMLSPRMPILESQLIILKKLVIEVLLLPILDECYLMGATYPPLSTTIYPSLPKNIQTETSKMHLFRLSNKMSFQDQVWGNAQICNSSLKILQFYLYFIKYDFNKFGKIKHLNIFYFDKFRIFFLQNLQFSNFL